MNARRYEIVLHETVRHPLSLEEVASRAGLHPELVQRFMDFSLIEPVDWEEATPRFDVTVVPTLRVIEHLRCDLGVNLAGVGVILEMLERMRELECENDELRCRL